MIISTLELFFCSVLAPGMPNGAFSVLFFNFCAVNRFDHGNPIEINKYKNKWNKSNQNINSYNKENLTFGMVYHYPQRLPIAGKKGVYQIKLSIKRSLHFDGFSWSDEKG